MLECVLLLPYIPFCNILVLLRSDGDVLDVFKNASTFSASSKLTLLPGEKEGLFLRNIFNEFDDSLQCFDRKCTTWNAF